MGVTTKLALYAVGLVVVFVAAFGAGSLVGPVLPDRPEGHSESVELPGTDGRDHDGDDDHDGAENHGGADGDQHQPPRSGI